MPKGVTIVIQGDGESARKALEMVREQLAQTNEEAKKDASEIASAMEAVKSALNFGAFIYAAREAVDALRGMVGSSVQLGMEIGHMAQETGISAENLSVLKHSADVTGVSFEALSKGSLKLSKTMLDAEEGNNKAINAFGRLGISQADVTAKSHDLFGMLELVADKFETMPDGPNKAAAAIGLFGKAGAQLIPYLDQGSAGIERLRGETEALGLTFDQEGIGKMEEMHEASIRLQGALQGLSISLTQGLTPALLQIENSFNSASSGMHTMEEAGRLLGVGLKVLVASFDNVMIALEEIEEGAYLAGVELYDFGALVAAVASKNLPAAANAMQEMQKDWRISTGVMKNDAREFAAELDALWKPERLMDRRPKNAGGRGGDDVRIGNQAKPDGSGDSIARAAAALAEAQTQAQAAAVQAANSRILAELDAGHKAQLLSDSDFYREKLLLEKDSLDAQIDAARSKEAELQALLKAQAGEKLKRDKNGNSAEELKTKTELVQLEQKLNELAEKRAALDPAYQAAQQVRADEVRLATAKAAAAVEEQTNTTISARLALLRLESEEELKKVGDTAGKDSPEYAQVEALEKLKEAKLQIGEVNRQIVATEDDYKRAVDELNDAASKDPRLKAAAEKRIDQLNAQEAAQLKDLVAQYQELAQVLGGDYLNAAKNLQTELDKLNRPSDRGDAQFTKTLADGAESMAKRMADAAVSGRQSFHTMAKSIEKDLLDLAIKLATEKWLTPALQGNGRGLPQVSPGSAAVGLLGAGAPSLAGPQNAASAAGGIFEKIFEGGGKGGGGMAPKVIINVENGSGTPVTMSQSNTSFNSDAGEYIVHVVMEAASSGGPLARMFGATL